MCLYSKKKQLIFLLEQLQKCLILRPDENHKRFHNGKTDVSNIDEGFVKCLAKYQIYQKRKKHD